MRSKIDGHLRILINEFHAEYRTDHSGRYSTAWALVRIPEDVPSLFPSNCWSPFLYVTCSLFRRNRILLNLKRFQKNHLLSVLPEVIPGARSQRLYSCQLTKRLQSPPYPIFPILNQSYQSCFTTVTLSICRRRIFKDSFELIPQLIAQQLLKDLIHRQ